MSAKETILQVTVVALSVIGFYGILHAMFECLLTPRELGTAVILSHLISPAELDILLCEARRALLGRGKRVVLSIPARLLREGMGEEGTLIEEYAELVEKYGATLCVCADPAHNDT